MTWVDNLIALVIAGAALYGLGIPLAWLLPAPAGSAWVFRVAIAPLYAIVLASLAASLLRTVGLPLHPLELVGLAAAAWLLAARRNRGQWQVSMGSALGLPLAMVSSSGAIWFFSLVGFGLYLPNRDFKNHAYWVAQVAYQRTSDPSRVLVSSPLGDSDGSLYYPLGLHTLLGWALPTPTWNALGVTAAAAVLVSCLSVPLALVTLARIWDPQSRRLWLLAGLAGVVFPGFTSGFAIGSVVLLAGTALFAAALACLWIALIEPAPGAVMALGFAALGLLLMHVAEAFGLACVALAAFLVRRTWRVVAPSWRLAGAALAPIVVGLVVLAPSVSSLGDRASSEWDISPNTVSPLIAWTVPLLIQPGGLPLLQFGWLLLTFAGMWLAHRRGMDPFPILTLVVVLVLAWLASASGLPVWLTSLTAPWYGSPSRISLLGAAPIALLGCLAVARLMEARERRIARMFGLAGLALTVAMSATLTPMRRSDLSQALAGAGDTPALAQELSGMLQPGQTVLNFEEDGTSNLFALQRIPILDGVHGGDEVVARSETSIEWVQSRLLRLSEPAVAQRMKQLGVAYIAIGTTTRYWGTGPGYNWQMVARQPEVEPVLFGSDMVILSYRSTP